MPWSWIRKLRSPNQKTSLDGDGEKREAVNGWRETERKVADVPG